MIALKNQKSSIKLQNHALNKKERSKALQKLLFDSSDIPKTAKEPKSRSFLNMKPSPLKKLNPSKCVRFNAPSPKNFDPKDPTLSSLYSKSLVKMLNQT